MTSRIRIDLNHFKTSDYRLFYEPSDDSWLFTDTLDLEITHLKEILQSPSLSQNDRDSNDTQNDNRLKICAEVGSGSGYVSTYLYKLLETQSPDLMKDSLFFLCTDINPNAADATRKTMEHNGVNMNKVDIVQTSFLSALMPRLKNQIDVLLFNPPYVPSEEDELGHDDCHAAYAGGANGREVIDLFLPIVKDTLSCTGTCYMIAIEDNKPQEIMSIMSSSEYGSFTCSIVSKKKVLGEILYVLKFAR